MQELLSKILWYDDEIYEAANRLRRTIPGYQEAERAYEDLAGKIRALVGYELYDQYYTQLIQYTNYEVRAFYSLGLGLREGLVQTLEL